MLWYIYRFEWKGLKQTRMISGETMLEAVYNIGEILRQELKSSHFKIIYIRELDYADW